MAKICLLCLDFDGVILESNTIRDQAWRDLFSDQPADVQARIVHFHRVNPGIDRAVKLRRIYVELLGQTPTENQILQQIELFQGYCESALMNSPLVPGLVGFLETVDVPLVVLTAAREVEVKVVCAKREFTWFSAIRGGPDNKVQHLRRLMNEYELPASEILFIGDQRTDLAAASEVGCFFIGRIAPDRPASFGVDIPIVHDLNTSWGDLISLLD